MHLWAKLRARLVGREGKGVRVGDRQADVVWLREQLTKTAGWAAAGVNIGDLSLDDPMNIGACERLFSSKLLLWIKQHLPPDPPRDLPPLFASPSAPPEPAVRSAGTAHLLFYLEVASGAVTSYVEAGLPEAERVRRVFFAFYGVLALRADALARGDFKEVRLLGASSMLIVLQNCITSNAIDCILMNAKTLLMLYIWMCRYPVVRRVLPICLPLWTSQPCENLFRDIRMKYVSSPNLWQLMLLSHGNNTAGFSIEGLLQRLNSACQHAQVAANYATTGQLVYPRTHKVASAQSILQPPECFSQDVTEYIFCYAFSVLTHCRYQGISACRRCCRSSAGAGALLPAEHQVEPVRSSCSSGPCHLGVRRLALRSTPCTSLLQLSLNFLLERFVSLGKERARPPT